MQSLVLCHTAADAHVARQLQQFLEINCPFPSWQEAVVFQSGDALLSSVERALSADIALLLLSPNAVPATWRREDWEPVLISQPRQFGSELGYLCVHPCRFPEVLRRKNFFDLSADLLGGFRKVKRWLLQENPLKQETVELLPPLLAGANASGESPENLRRQLADAPGVVYDVSREAALEFAYAHTTDFEGVFWVNCARRSQAGILGDTAHALGLKLAGRAAQNRLALVEFCAQRRCLFVFEHLVHNRDLVNFGNRASVMFVAAQSEPAVLPLDKTAELFANWKRDPLPCLQSLGDAQEHLRRLANGSEALAHKALGASIFALLQQSERLAEAYEVLDVLSKHAWAEGDSSDLRRWEWEKSWIREAWDETASRCDSPGHSAPTGATGFEFLSLSKGLFFAVKFSKCRKKSIS